MMGSPGESLPVQNCVRSVQSPFQPIGRIASRMISLASGRCIGRQSVSWSGRLPRAATMRQRTEARRDEAPGPITRKTAPCAASAARSGPIPETPLTRRSLCGHDGPDRPSRPGRRGHLSRRPRRARVPAAVDHRPGRRPSAALQRGRHHLDGLQRRDLQLPRAAAAAGGQGAHAPLAAATPRSSSTSTRTRERGCSRLLRGMFALAIWDAPRRTLVLARDRLGQKPLVYRHDGARLVFASELKALLALPEQRRPAPGRSRWRSTSTLTYGYVPAPRTILGGDAQAAARALCRLARRDARASSATGAPTGTSSASGPSRRTSRSCARPWPTRCASR